MPSQSDKLFQKRKAKNKEDLARRKATIPEGRRLLMICEGEKTEPLYLRALASNLGLTAFEICSECDSAPISLVQCGKQILISDPDFDLIFFVFDRDSHSSYEEALNLIKGLQNQKNHRNKTIRAITSIPCFEIWFLLHFEAHNSPYVASNGKSSCENLISTLKEKKGFENYAKGHGGYFNLLADRLPQAKVFSDRILKQSIDAGEPKHHGNSTTLMHILIEELQKLAEDNKR